MAGAAQIIGSGIGVDRHLDGAGPVLGGYAGGDAPLRAGINAHGEGGLVVVGVAGNHQGQVEGIEPLPLHGQADQPPGFGGHEIDLLRRGKLGRADQIPLVLSVLVINHHHHFAAADGGQGIGDGIEADGLAGERHGRRSRP